MFRTDQPFFKPSEDYEIIGQVGNVVFVQGLVYFNEKWLLYYGTADSKIAVAEAVGYSSGAISLDMYEDEGDNGDEDLTNEEEQLLGLSNGEEVSAEAEEEILKERIYHRIKQKLQRDAEKKKKRRASKLKPHAVGTEF